MAGLSELVEAATEGMRKTQSADPIEENSNQPPPPTKDDGHLSDSAVAPTRERKKGELFSRQFAAVRSFFTKAPAPHLVRARLRERRTRGNSRCRTSANPYVFIPSFSAGVPWTEDEHRLFLLGLQKLGKVSSGGYCLSELSSRRQSRFFYPGGARTARRRREARDRTSRSPGLFRSISASRRPFRPVAAMENLFGRQRPFVFARGTGGTLRALRCSTRQRSA